MVSFRWLHYKNLCFSLRGNCVGAVRAERGCGGTVAAEQCWVFSWGGAGRGGVCWGCVKNGYIEDLAVGVVWLVGVVSLGIAVFVKICVLQVQWLSKGNPNIYELLRHKKMKPFHRSNFSHRICRHSKHFIFCAYIWPQNSPTNS